MKEIQLSQFGKNRGKYVALVDDEDFEALNQFRWHVSKSRNTIYAVRNVLDGEKKTMMRMHCMILKRKGIDHIDMNGLNNQKDNLRLCTRSENSMNINKRKQESCTSIYKGVAFYKHSGKWTAQIGINGKKIHIGYFASEVEAAKAYNAKAIELFCEFANLNLISHT